MTTARGTGRLTVPSGFLFVSGILILAYFLLPATAQAPIYLTLSCGAAVAAFTASRNRVVHRLPWSLLAAGLALWSAGDAIWWGYVIFSLEPPYPSVADVMYFAGYPLVVAAGVTLVREIRPGAATGVVSAAAAAVGLGLVLWASAISAGTGPLWEQLVIVGAPVFDAMVLGTILLIVIGTAALATPTMISLVGGFSSLLAVDTGYALLLSTGKYQEGTLLDAGWLFFFGCIGYAALHPSSQALDGIRDASASLTRPRFALLCAALLTVPITAAAGHQGADRIVWLFGAALVAILVCVRVWLMFTEQQSEIAQRTSTEAALRSSREQYRVVVENSSDLIKLADEDGNIVYASPSHETTLGLRPEQLVGTHLLDWVHPDDVAMSREALARLWSGGGDLSRGESRRRLRRHDGTWAATEAAVALVADDAGRRLALVTATDVTERDSLEEARRALLQAQKLEAVGMLAGGIAHDFNNVLAAVTGYSELLLSGSLEPGARAQVEEIKRAGERAGGLTRQLLAFSRRQTLQPVVLDLNETISGTENMLRRMIGEDVRIVSSLEGRLWPVLADPSQIEQVLVNLAVNARDAMPDGGRFSIETENCVLDASAAAKIEARMSPGEYCLVSVSDTGCGMTDDVRSRAFEPFFTTKSSSDGTGLGLSTTYGIVKQSGGEITIDSELGSGTTFRIYLPRTNLRIARPTIEAPPVIPGGSESILLVEDDAVVRDLTRELLERFGYRVTATGPGGAAAAITREHVDALVTDVVMPGLSGRDIADRVAQSFPDAGIIFCSGYSADVLGQNVTLTEHQRFLQKPYPSVDLARTLREVLDAGKRYVDADAAPVVASLEPVALTA